MEKQIINWHGKKYYLLGIDKAGRNHYLQAGSWDCGWYWGFGYVESFTNNRNPEKSKDINSHLHFNELFLNGANSINKWCEFFKDGVLNMQELWALLELMKSFYTAQQWSEACHWGGVNYSNNPCQELLKSNEEYNRINKVIIPTLMDEVYKLLTPEEGGDK